MGLTPESFKTKSPSKPNPETQAVDHSSGHPLVDMHQLHRRHRQRLHAADEYNRNQPERVAEFNRLTGHVCAGPNGVDVLKLRSWQRAKGLVIDGMVGPKTLAEAKRVDLSFEEGETVQGRRPHRSPTATIGVERPAPTTIGPERSDEEDGLAGTLVATGKTANQERQPGEDSEEEVKEAGTALSEGVEGGMKGVAQIEELEEAGPLASVGLHVAVNLARLPHVVRLLKAGEYQKAAESIKETFGYEDHLAILEFALKRAGLNAVELLPRLTSFMTAALPIIDLLKMGAKFQWDAIKALGKAKEKGERENHIYLYANAWVNALLYGKMGASSSSALTADQREAVTQGIEDGRATALLLAKENPHIGRQLLEAYGDERNARLALMDALCKQAGLEGIRLHHQGEI